MLCGLTGRFDFISSRVCRAIKENNACTNCGKDHVLGATSIASQKELHCRFEQLCPPWRETLQLDVCHVLSYVSTAEAPQSKGYWTEEYTSNTSAYQYCIPNRCYKWHYGFNCTLSVCLNFSPLHSLLLQSSTLLFIPYDIYQQALWTWKKFEALV